MNLATITIFYFILLSNSTHSPEFTGLINFLFICLFHFLLDPCGFGSATQKIRNEKISAYFNKYFIENYPVFQQQKLRC